MAVNKQPKHVFQNKDQKEEKAPPAPNCRTPGCGAGSAHAPRDAEGGAEGAQGQAGGQGGAPGGAAPAPAGGAQGQAPAPAGGAQAQGGQQQGGGRDVASPNPTGGAAPGGASAPAAPTPEQRWTNIETILRRSALGQQALDRKSSYGVGVNWIPGGGSYYNPGSNSMVIDSNQSDADAALTFVHEMNHAHYQNARLGAHGDNNISNMTREAYVESMLSEEVEGTVLSIEAKMELVAAGDTGAGSFPLETQYKAAYDAAKAAGKSDAEAKAAGRARVRKGFDDGEVVTSNTNQRYAEYYGSAWDRAHPSGGGGGW